MKIAVLIANGSEEIETITPIDVLRRAQTTCVVSSVNEIMVECSHGVTVKADCLVEDLVADDLDGIVIPGGMPGANNIASNQKAIELIKQLNSQGKMVSAICASPAVVLERCGITDNKKITCFPASQFIEMLKNANYTGNDVEVDGNIITANGPKSALKFAEKICEYLGVKPQI